MSDVQESLVSPSFSVKQIIETIDRSAAKVALVVDDEQRLLGTVTDGDIRRGLLRGVRLEDLVTAVMNKQPRVATLADDPAMVVDMMRRNICRQVPVVDEAGRVIALKTLDDILRVPQRPNWVFLMAGGRGHRLRPLTDSCPKPMLRIGGRPLLQIIIEGLARQGFSRFFLSVNYRREMIKSHFADGSRWNIKIEYIEEDENHPLGTAGAISLLPSLPDHPILVMNGDILTKVPFGSLLEFHAEHHSVGTMGVRDFVQQVPYGVIEADDHRLGQIVEKPVQRYLVNAGIYVLEPRACEIVPKGIRYDMPMLFEELRSRKLNASVFPIREYWLDIGRVDDFNRASDEFVNEFMDLGTIDSEVMIGQKRVLAVIGARGGSKGVPRKNIRNLGGKPLIAWTIDAAKGSRYLDRLILSSDNSEIIDIAASCNCEAPFVRPAELATDKADAMSVVRHALKSLAERYDYVVLLQPTSPLRTAEDIDRAIELCDTSGAPSCVGLCEPDKSPYWMFQADPGGRISPLVKAEAASRRQDVPVVYALNGAVYVGRTERIEAGETFVVEGTVGYVMPKERSFDIDTELDFKIVDAIVKHSDR